MAAAALCIEEGCVFIEFLKQVDGKSRPDRYYEQVAEVFAASACTLLHEKCDAVVVVCMHRPQTMVTRLKSN